MVRTAALGLLLLAAPVAAQNEPWSNDPIVEETVWTGRTASQSFYWATADGLQRGLGGEVTVWVHGLHVSDETVPYRTSLWLYHFNCRGYYQINAWTTYMADLSLRDNWDGLGRLVAVRPNTVDADLEQFVCAIPR